MVLDESPIHIASIVQPQKDAELRREILTPPLIAFLIELHRRFELRRKQLLQTREELQRLMDARQYCPSFREETRHIRDDPTWKVASIPEDLLDRRVEITGPADPKMVINALNSGANAFMADFEDSLAPTWFNIIRGQHALFKAVRGQLEYDDPATQRHYSVRPQSNHRPVVLMVRPRGWHLDERHFRVATSLSAEPTPISGALFDFGVYFFLNAHELLSGRSPVAKGPYFYLPKLESHLEARLWNDVFNFAQDYLAIPRGSIRATVLIETITAAFEMDEILFELRDHSAGLNCGRWDYIFSLIKKFREWPEFVLPDRDQVTMTTPFMDAYVQLLIRTCHRRGIHAMGGMAAQIPVKDNRIENDQALQKVSNDKMREVLAGHDGTWVAHPGLIDLTREIFNRHMRGNMHNQIHFIPTSNGPQITRDDLLRVPDLSSPGTRFQITEHGVSSNINVCIRYLESWLRGIGCVPINNLMEDAATAEICRCQVWQWLRHRVRLNDGRHVTQDLVQRLLDREFADLLSQSSGTSSNNHSTSLETAKLLVLGMIFSPKLSDFMTSAAYDHLVLPHEAVRVPVPPAQATASETASTQQQFTVGASAQYSRL